MMSFLDRRRSVNAVVTVILLLVLQSSHALTSTEWCSNGIASSNGACCHKDCGACGGQGCSGFPGGVDRCCTSHILGAGQACSDPYDTVCVIPSTDHVTARGGGHTSTGENSPSTTSVVDYIIGAVVFIVIALCCCCCVVPAVCISSQGPTETYEAVATPVATVVPYEKPPATTPYDTSYQASGGGGGLGPALGGMAAGTTIGNAMGQNSEEGRRLGGNEGGWGDGGGYGIVGDSNGGYGISGDQRGGFDNRDGDIDGDS